MAPRIASGWPHRCGFGLPEAGGTGAWSAFGPGAARLRPCSPGGAGGLRSPALPLHSARPLLVLRRRDAPWAPGRAGEGASRARNWALAARGQRQPVRSLAARPRRRPAPPLVLRLPASGTRGGEGRGSGWRPRCGERGRVSVLLRWERERGGASPRASLKRSSFPSRLWRR